MSNQIIKQPNGMYCIFSSNHDNITYYDMSPPDIVDYLVSDYRKKVEEDVNRIIGKLEKGGNPYYQFTITFDKMIKTIEEIHGEKESKRVLNLIT